MYSNWIRCVLIQYVGLRGESLGEEDTVCAVIGQGLFVCLSVCVLRGVVLCVVKKMMCMLRCVCAGRCLRVHVYGRVGERGCVVNVMVDLCGCKG